MSTIQFTPASVHAFKRTARDLQTYFGNPLQECQEALAKGYGYPDLHALMEHLKTNPSPGPYPDEVESWEDRFKLRQTIPGMVERNLTITRIGRARADDLGVTEKPEYRAVIMDRNRAIDDLVAGRANPESDAKPSDYFWFEKRNDPKEVVLGLTEGVLRLTEKGALVHQALVYSRIQRDGTVRDTEDEQLANRETALRTLQNAATAHPSNPYVLAEMLRHNFYSWGNEMPKEVAVLLWRAAVACRRLFEEVVPKGFRHSIEPKLVGGGAANFPYVEVLWCGAVCAGKIGLTEDALKWARKGRTLNKNDNFGFSYFVKTLA